MFVLLFNVSTTGAVVPMWRNKTKNVVPEDYAYVI